MAKENNWNFNLEDGTPVTVTMRKNKWISVNGGNETNCKELKDGVESNFFENVFNIPLENGESVKLFVSTTNKVLTYQGKDVTTGEEYLAAKVPAWSYAFIVLYVINWLFIIGGAIGAVIDLFAVAYTVQTATRSKKGTGAKVGLCIAIYVVVTILSLILAGLLANVLN
ncbi:MAG: hypothetical protein II571_09140 [Lachnospiraceae bacterium]|jgi:hypothetical protein|nr:hypothetical protein [Lachnospiraceae bacterium]MBQ1721300.1 hypothetical protein [Lachnospiraceae bacterium]MBQ2317878.1 hypothetical protein [Lachnospiraceae bacterium]MBQ2532779.1 hypothetical protein [Lachnospiraceae bacterium]MBQ2579573.1 hypothetical protein [Lachnospiraceae bacterium]